MSQLGYKEKYSTLFAGNIVLPTLKIVAYPMSISFRIQDKGTVKEDRFV